jgi:hypothetical protein
MALTKGDYKQIHEAIKLSRVSQASLAKSLAIDAGYFSTILTGKKAKAEDQGFEQSLVELVMEGLGDSKQRGLVSPEMADQTIEKLSLLLQGESGPRPTRFSVPGAPITEAFDNFIHSSLVKSSDRTLWQSNISVVCAPIMSGKTTAVNHAAAVALSGGAELLHIDCSGLSRGITSDAKGERPFLEFARRFVATLSQQLGDDKALDTVELAGIHLVGAGLGEIVIQMVRKSPGKFLLILDNFESMPLSVCLEVIEALRTLVNLISLYGLHFHVYVSTPRHFQRIADAHQNPDDESAISWLLVGAPEDDGWFNRDEVMRLAELYGSDAGEKLYAETNGQPYLTHCFLHHKDPVSPNDYFETQCDSPLLDRYVRRARSAQTDVQSAFEELGKTQREQKNLRVPVLDKMLRDNLVGLRTSPPAVRTLLSDTDLLPYVEVSDE